MGLKNVSLCRYYAVMPHMCHYADFDAGIKGLPQILVNSKSYALAVRRLRLFLPETG